MTKKNDEVKIIPVDQETQIALRSDCRTDTVDLDREDLVIPRAKLLQALSPEISDGDGSRKVGEIVNSLSGEVVPEIFTPIFMFKTWIRFNPRSTTDAGFDPNFGTGDIIWRANSKQDASFVERDTQWLDNKKPLATCFMNFFCLFEGQNEPVIVSFSNTSYNTGKRLLSLYHFSGQNMFAKKYKLYSKKETKDVGTYYVLNVDPVGDVSDDIYRKCKEMWNGFSNKENLEIHEEDIDTTQKKSTDEEMADTPF